MTYTELKKIFTDFHTGKITKKELCFAIGLWQKKEYNKIADYPEWMNIFTTFANGIKCICRVGTYNYT